MSILYNILINIFLEIFFYKLIFVFFKKFKYHKRNKNLIFHFFLLIKFKMIKFIAALFIFLALIFSFYTNEQSFSLKKEDIQHKKSFSSTECVWKCQGTVNKNH